MNVAPAPGADVTVSVPPCATAIARPKREPEPRARAIVGEAHAGLEDALLILTRDPGTQIRHGDAELARVFLHDDRDQLVSGRDLDGVRDEIVENLPQSNRIRADARRTSGDDANRRAEERRCSGGLLRDPSEIHVLQADRGHGRIGNHALDALARCDGEIGERAPLRRVEGPVSVHVLRCRRAQRRDSAPRA